VDSGRFRVVVMRGRLREVDNCERSLKRGGWLGEVA
jgi:hypothetical protein